MDARPAQHTVDERNRVFWDELCGSGLARSLGITEITAESLARFDTAYLEYYPYLVRYLDALPVEGRDVLEIGLGFGTVGQLLAARGARYRGADIAAGPVAMMRDRLRWLGRGADEDIVEASVLDLPWADDSFDVVVSIGCLHHTGDLPRSVAEVQRVLRPGGTAFVMLYNAHSFRQLVLARRERRRAAREARSADAEVRGMYDANSAGEAAPHTDFVARREARRLFAAFASVSVQSQNSDPLVVPLGRRRVTIPRERLLPTLGRVLGLDLYIHARK
ncbi:MAG TPA: class I SAM-dependent methyltransferase [Gaiellaceae bacterium]|nr:class I SAM-dependent methyltransferase [Gaiellaceae bacterium]